MPHRAKQLDLAEATSLAKHLLKGAGFAGFSFHTGFTLVFDRGKRNHGAPARVDLAVDSRISVGAPPSWAGLVERLGPKGHVEPEEPVVAYELARLRWTEGSEVKDVRLDGAALTLEFESGVTLVVHHSTYGLSWLIKEHGLSSEESPWLLLAEQSELYGRRPE